MPTTTLLVVLGNILFVIACGTIGVHLTLLARRTSRTPELLLGSGLLLIVTGIPMLALSGMGRVTIGELRLPLVIAGLALLSLSVVCQTAFVWRTFRPSTWWAPALTALLGVAELLVAGAILQAILNAAPDTPAVEVTHQSVSWIRLPFAISYSWTAIEGFQQYRMAQRRQKLGIGDPVLTNRFLLWSCTGALACSNVLVSSALHMLGVTPFNHPLGAALMGIGSTIASVTLSLVFLPPARYVGWVRGLDTSPST